MSLSEEQIAELRAAFNQMDTNGDGTLSRDELKALLGELDAEMAEAFVEEMMNKADTNGDGKIDFEEFCATAMQ